MEDVKIQICSDIGLLELAELAATNYNRGGITQNDYLDWQYYKNPWGKPFMVTSRETGNNELVGQYLVIPYEYINDGKLLKGTLSLNTITRNDYRGKGLFVKMAQQTYNECARSDYNFTVGFPNKQSFHGLSKRLDFNLVGQVPFLIKPFYPVRILFRKFFQKAEKHGDDITIEYNPASIKGVRFDLLSPELDSNCYKQFWDEYKENIQTSLNKNWDFFYWRYFTNPVRNYYVIKASIGNKTIGIVILRIEKTLGLKAGIIMDFMCLPDFIDAGKLLIKHLSRTLREYKIEIIVTLSANNTVERNILKKSGFWKLPLRLMPQPIPLMIRINKKFDGSEKLLDFERWQVGFGDYDIF